jgi:hypothetical protein
MCRQIVGGPTVEQGGNRRAELVEKIAELEALLGIQRDIGHTRRLSINRTRR